MAEVLELSGTKLSTISTVDLIEDISTNQGSFNRLNSVPKVCKYSKLIILPEADLHLFQFLKSSEQLPTFKDQLYSKLDDPSKDQLNMLFQKYSV